MRINVQKGGEQNRICYLKLSFFWESTIVGVKERSNSQLWIPNTTHFPALPWSLREIPQGHQPRAFPDCPVLHRPEIAASGVRIDHRPDPGTHTLGDLGFPEASERQLPGVMSPDMV
ncbi:hypothetical protein PHMEG_00013830 [Phytophthora megakarya]|uniref:Uncharacterized protein n=1 Tax=Phytophthora megakarya TaxID=4795 RepID=A0A225W5B2_9STRA|nr:hypothetical protein PHMEG_00013830 [Phytophthora megakarya]